MARPSQNLDKKLIQLGKERMISQGISNLSVRQICLDAKINLGMFYYYFKSKENFIKALFKNINDDFTSVIIAEAAKLSTSEEKLKKVLFMKAKMMREHRSIIETIIKDTNIFDKIYVEIGREIYGQWLQFYTELVNDCKKDGYLDNSIETDILISVINGAVHHYAKHCEFLKRDEREYYGYIKNMIDCLIKKLK